MQSPTCYCGLNSIKLQCKNSSNPANIGRSFFTCQKPQDSEDRCKFFSWADEVNSKDIDAKLDELLEGLEKLKMSITKILDMVEEQNNANNKNKKRKI